MAQPLTDCAAFGHVSRKTDEEFAAEINSLDIEIATEAVPKRVRMAQLFAEWKRNWNLPNRKERTKWEVLVREKCPHLSIGMHEVNRLVQIGMSGDGTIEAVTKAYKEHQQAKAEAEKKRRAKHRDPRGSIDRARKILKNADLNNDEKLDLLDQLSQDYAIDGADLQALDYRDNAVSGEEIRELVRIYAQFKNHGISVETVQQLIEEHIECRLGAAAQ